MKHCGNWSSNTRTWSRRMPLAPCAADRGPASADRGHRDRAAAQQLEVVGDVAAAAELAGACAGPVKHVQDVHLVRQDVVLELVGEHHDGVVGRGNRRSGPPSVGLAGASGAGPHRVRGAPRRPAPSAVRGQVPPGIFLCPDRGHCRLANPAQAAVCLGARAPIHFPAAFPHCSVPALFQRPPSTSAPPTPLIYVRGQGDRPQRAVGRGRAPGSRRRRARGGGGGQRALGRCSAAPLPHAHGCGR